MNSLEYLSWHVAPDLYLSAFHEFLTDFYRIENINRLGNFRGSLPQDDLLPFIKYESLLRLSKMHQNDAVEGNKEKDGRGRRITNHKMPGAKNAASTPGGPPHGHDPTPDISEINSIADSSHVDMESVAEHTNVQKEHSPAASSVGLEAVDDLSHQIDPGASHVLPEESNANLEES